MAKPYKFTPSDVPARRTNRLCVDVVADSIAQRGEETYLVRKATK